jgi:hypothetical protein
MTVARFFGSVLAAACVATSAQADFQIRETLTDAGGKSLAERTFFVSASRVRLDDGEVAFVLDVSTGKVLWVDHRAKAWRQTQLAPDNRVRRLANDPGSADWQSRLGALTAEIESAAPLRVVTTSETKQVAGLLARRTDLFRGNRKVRERWHAEALPTDDIGTAMLRLVEYDPTLAQQRYFQEFQATAHLGYPVLIRDLERGVVLEVKEIKRGPAPPALFAAPQGYRRSD